MFRISKRHFVGIASAGSGLALVAMALSVSLGGVVSAHPSSASDDVLTAQNAKFETGGQTGVQLTPNWQTTFGTSGKVSPSQYTTIPAYQSAFTYQGKPVKREYGKIGKSLKNVVPSAPSVASSTRMTIVRPCSSIIALSFPLQRTAGCAWFRAGPLNVGGRDQSENSST